MNYFFKDHNKLKLSLSAIALSMSINATSVQAQNEQGKKATSSFEEIIVTARRREESIQDVPIAITAFTEDALKARGVTDGWNLQKATPSLIGSSGFGHNDLAYSMRGQTGGGTATSAAPVVTYLNDVPIGNTGASAIFYDVANVQVLAGPQGTLFGLNSTGGAVLINSKRPTDQLEGYLSVGTGNLGYQQFEGAANIPLSDKFAIRLAANISERDGYTYDQTYDQWYDGNNENNFRISALWKPTENIENLTVYDRREIDEVGPAFQIAYLDEGTSQPIVDALNTQQALGIRTIRTSPNRAGPSIEQQDSWGLSNHTTIEFENFAFKNILGYRRAPIGEQRTDGDGSTLNLVEIIPNQTLPITGSDGLEGIKQLSEEVQLIGKAFDDKLDWIIGAFYMKTTETDQLNVDVTQVLPVPPFSLPIELALYTDIERESKAIFTQGSYDASALLEGLSLTAGIRYTEDETYSNGGQLFLRNSLLFGFPPCGSDAFLSAANCRKLTEGKSDATTYNLSAEYKFNDSSLLYLAHRRGYKAADVNDIAASFIEQFPGIERDVKPEIVEDFELGYKTDWSIGDVAGRFNGALYFSDYTDIQRGTRLPDTTPVLYNGAEADIKGFEGLFAINPTENLELSLSYSYVDAEYNNFTDPLTNADLSGNKFSFVPQNKYTLTAIYTIPLNTGEVRSSLSLSGQDEFFYVDNTIQFQNRIVPSRELVDARVDWTEAFGQSMTLSLFINNLTDDDYVANGDNGVADIGRYFYGAPRTYGLELRYDFGQ